MASTRKKTKKELIPLEPLQNRLFDFEWKNGRIVMRNLQASDIDLLVSHGYGKGTLSRNAPNFHSRQQEGMTGATTSNPFATPSRMPPTASPPHNIDFPAIELGNLSISEPAYEEEFQLGFEEALYLVEEVGVAQITSTDHPTPFSGAQLFLMFTDLQKGFEYRYYAYKYYRDLSWVVKLGSKVGVDLLLYPLGGPTHQHAQYGVCIKTPGTPTSSHFETPWGAATRVLDTVAKNLLVVIINCAHVEGNTERFSGWTLEQVSLSRWHSNLTTKTA